MNAYAWFMVEIIFYKWKSEIWLAPRANDNEGRMMHYKCWLLFQQLVYSWQIKFSIKFDDIKKLTWCKQFFHKPKEADQTQDQKSCLDLYHRAFIGGRVQNA